MRLVNFVLLFRRVLKVALKGRQGRDRCYRGKSIHTLVRELEGGLNLHPEDQLYGCSSLDLFSKGLFLKGMVPSVMMVGDVTDSEKQCLVGVFRSLSLLGLLLHGLPP